MNTLKGFWRGSSRRSSSSATQDNSLGLMHLRKLYVELCCSVQPLTQKEQEDKLYVMLPLFCKVFEASPASDMKDKFGDVHPFTGHISRLFVTEVRRRASNPSPEKASRDIAEYIEIQGNGMEDRSRGWMLLRTLTLLSSGGQSIVDVMTTCSLPSTLVKCLYLFFDLPPIEHDQGSVDQRDGQRNDFSPYERRVLLQKVFLQLLTRLCNHQSPADELVRRDDLTLLFSAITSCCPPHNLPWRKGAAEVLITISRMGLDQNVVQYIHNKGCLALCIENIKRPQELSPLDMVEMCFTVFHFLKDSSDVSHILLDDFRTCQGYIFLADFVLRLEKMESQEASEALRNLIFLISSLSMCGFNELRPNSSIQDAPFQQHGFTVPTPIGNGVSVRNLQSFQVLQTVFLKAETTFLCTTILDVVSSIYNSDPANYFILEPQHTLSQFIDRMYLKSDQVQEKIFELLEFVVFNLNFVPCKELISVSLLMKGEQSIDCSIIATRYLLKILRHSAIYQDVYREVGLLEVMVTCLRRYATKLKDNQNENNQEMSSVPKIEIPEKQEMLAFLMMEALTLLLNNNPKNASVFGECGGARCVHNLVPYLQCRSQALAVVQQLILGSNGDDDMGTLLALMHSAPVTELTLKADILQSILYVLRESHKARLAFRKVGGFVYVMSVLVAMESCLADNPSSPWSSVSVEQIFQLLHVVFQTISAAMRHEPANAKFFVTEIRFDSLKDAIRLLGCFSKGQEVMSSLHQSNSTSSHDEVSNLSTFYNLFDISDSSKGKVARSLQSVCLLLRCLYDLAVDAYESKSAEMPINAPSMSHHVHDAFTPLPTPPTSPSRSPDEHTQLKILEQAKKRNSLSPSPSPARTPTAGLSHSSTKNSISSGHSQPPPHPTIVHPGAVISLLDLLPAIGTGDNDQLGLALQIHTTNVIQELVKSERNQQVMCEAGLPQRLLYICNVALADEDHPLHMNLQHTLERLASQSLEPKDLRDFLRLGSPLNCKIWDDKYKTTTENSNSSSPLEVLNSLIDSPEGGSSLNESTASKCTCNICMTEGSTVPLTRVKCLVSMTTPRDVRLNSSSVTPAFVEFDMSANGYGCLYLPSIAPQSTPSQGVVSSVGMTGGSDTSIISGVGSGERPFPPQSGLTYSVWFCVDRYGTADFDNHQTRLLTVVRNIVGTDHNYVCLSVNITAHDRFLVISSLERPVSKAVGDEAASNDYTVKVWCPELAQEGQWHHLVVVLNRAVMKSSSISIYVDGVSRHTQRMHYIQLLPGGNVNNPGGLVSIYAYIGTPTTYQSSSRLLWRLGPAHLFEDGMNGATIAAIYNLGPTYVGSFQAPKSEAILSKNDLYNLQIAEDRIIFGIHAHALSTLTISKIRKIFNKVDSKACAKQLVLSSHDNATPIRILHNSAGHLTGTGRSLGAVLFGNMGIRTFCPKPVASTLENVGGSACLLGLVAMATDVEGLYAAVKALVCVVKNNGPAMQEMERTHGYQILAMLLKKKKHLLNSHILHLTFSLVGTIDSGRETLMIPHEKAFEDLLADLELWHNAPNDLQRSLFEHLHELLTDSSDLKKNGRLFRSLRMVNRLINMLHNHYLSHSNIVAISNLLQVLLQGVPSSTDLLRFAQFLVSTLPSSSADERCVTKSDLEFLVGDAHSPVKDSDSVSDDGSSAVSAHDIHLRNVLLEMLFNLLHTPGTNNINHSTCDEIHKILGLDWVLLFMQGHCHPTTVILGLRILLALLYNQSMISCFREGRERSYGGGWLDQTDQVLQNRVGVVLGFNVGKSRKVQAREINKDACHQPGFQVLQWWLQRHADVPQVYFLLMALMLGQPVQELGEPGSQLDLDTMWKFVFGVPANQPIGNKLTGSICPDAGLVILSQIRVMLNGAWQDEDERSWLMEYPVILVQFLLFLYHNLTDFKPVCTSADFLCGLASCLFPYQPHTEQTPHSFPCDEEDLTVVGDETNDILSPSEEFKFVPGFMPFLASQNQDKSGSSHGNLTDHPARKLVINFLRVIIVDSLSLSMPSKTPPVLDLVLEATPERASTAQIHEFQTEMLTTLMEHFLMADVLIGEEAALPLVTGGSYNNLIHNVFYFASRVVDKLWQGVFTKDSKEVFDFIAQLIAQAKKRESFPKFWAILSAEFGGKKDSSSRGLSLDNIYHCLNRTIMFQLSRPHSNVAGNKEDSGCFQMQIESKDLTALLEALHCLTTNRSLVFGPGNYESEFIGCLCHLLFCLTADASGSNTCSHCQTSDSVRTTTWHVEPLLRNNDKNELTQSSNQEGQLLVRNAARRVWDELIQCKKQLIEDIFKLTLPCKTIQHALTGGKSSQHVDLRIARETMSEHANKMWLEYINKEKKISVRDFQQQQSRFARVGSGLTRLATKKLKRESSIQKFPVFGIQDAINCTLTHVAIVDDLVKLQYSQAKESQQYFQKYIQTEWNQMEVELTRERGLWGPPHGSKLDKWILDLTEGPSRMRKKMIRNDMFYLNYPHIPDVYKDAAESPIFRKVLAKVSDVLADRKEKPCKVRMAMSLDSREFFSRKRVQKLMNTPQPDSPVSESTSDSDIHGETLEEEEGIRTGIRPSSLVTRKDKTEEEETDVNEADTPGDKEENTTDNQMVLRLLEEGEIIRYMFRCARIQGLDTSEGLLLFCKDHFYVVDGFTLHSSHEICDVDSLPAKTQENQDPIIPRTSHCSRSVSKKMCSKFAYEDIREVHKRRYLLQPIAIEVFSSDGRNHFLAFPRKIRNKVYARFVAEATRLTDDANQSVSGMKRNAQIEGGTSFLGLGNLIGEKSVTQRWERGEISNFQYLMYLNTLAGRSYNDLMQYPVFPWILADYESEELNLADPTTFRNLSQPMGAQTPERLGQFNKRYREWEDPTGETPAYHYGTHYSSAMIVASYLVRMEPFTQHFLRLQGGHFDLADRMFHSVSDSWQSASKHNMADVKELIPEFFYLPEFMTNHNNFDFGVKQNGTRLGDVILPPWAKGDPKEFIRMHREALECDYVSSHLHEWIDLIFGYKQSGQAAVEANNVFHHLFYEGNVDIYSIDDPLRKNATIGFINNFGQIVKQLFKKPHPPKKFNNRVGDQSGSTVIQIDRLFFHNLDLLRPALYPIKEIKGPVGQIIQTDKSIVCVEQNKVLIPPSYHRYFAFGFADLSLRLGNYDTDRLTTVFEGTQCGEILTATCATSKILITGGTSTVVHVWEYSTSKEKSNQLTLKRALYGHTDAVTCLAVCTSYNIIISGSRDKTCMIWDYNQLVFIRQLRDLGAPVTAVCINNLTGDIASCSGVYLHLWSINGDLIASVNTSTGREQQILCCAMSELVEWDQQNVIMTGSSDGVIRMWSVEFVQVPKENTTNDKVPEKVPSETSSRNDDHHDTLTANNHDTPDNLSDADTKSIDSALSAGDLALMCRVSKSDPWCYENGNDAQSTCAIDDGMASIESSQYTVGEDLAGTGTIYRSTSSDDVKTSQPVSLSVTRADSNNQLDDDHVGMEPQYSVTPENDSLINSRGQSNVNSPTSPLSSSDYIIITDSELEQVKDTKDEKESNTSAMHRNILKPGFKWQRQLMFRSKLTMHTAFERKDNTQPAHVTSLAISRDHLKVFVGDDKGRVFSWTVADPCGKGVADHWVKDELGEKCNQCGVKFTLTERRHHCRDCGNIFCQKCSRYESVIPRLRITKLVRVCQACYYRLKSA
ncbi:WD repeat and FYVE domain-containing protein 3-like isoform X3 [Anneissia japonica]|uniref:WD repeat and FYVE domain-containing protein 3-like isoform X3 n=1 Tax=Anneissia japonica TaxID=1529436 RepID=UPI00142596BB|nr:WD repeat and FYVE domain-containing protein 3-like isoform X3 [Anneissia japonica]